MKLSNALSLLTDLQFALSVALLPTLKAILWNPTLLLRPRALSRVIMANIWLLFGPGTDSNAKGVKEGLITPNAYGIVLDIGAGHGHSVLYLNRARVSRYIALEPNVLMHEHIRANANTAGYHESDGTLVILSCGAEDPKSILSSLSLTAPPNTSGQPQLVDTMISILTLCTIPEPQKSISNLVRHVLKPGSGQFLMYEHVLSKRDDVAWWQRFWAPVWAIVFDGCRMDRPSDDWVKGLTLDGKDSAWRESKTWVKNNDPEENLFIHSVGRFVKK